MKMLRTIRLLGSGLILSVAGFAATGQLQNPVVAPAPQAQLSNSTNYQLVSGIFDSGGGAKSSANYQLNDVIGHGYQTGVSSSSNYRLASGFLQAANPASLPTSTPIATAMASPTPSSTPPPGSTPTPSQRNVVLPMLRADPPPPPPPCSTPGQDCGEPNNSVAQAFDLNSRFITIHAIANTAGDDRDYYKIPSSPGKTVTLKLRATTGDLDMTLRDGNVTVFKHSGNQFKSDEDIEFNVPGSYGGVLVIQISSFGAAGAVPYTLEVVVQ